MTDFAQRIAALPPEKRALLLRTLNARVDSPRRLGDDPIAIVGIGCRFPGGADDPRAFWRLLREGRDAITEVPGDRWDIDAYYNPDPAAPGKMSTRWGGFLAGVDEFDAAFFGISTREAAQIDPKQRLLLEVAWEAIEDAGQTRERLAGSRTGVFVAVYQSDHVRSVMMAPADVDGYAGLGAQQSLAANRLSYWLDLRGPSLVVDTACSSSLVAVHLACRSLLSRESSVAIVGAVNLLLLPEESIAVSKLRMMAADGRCKAFDARADGFVRSDGCGALVLKRLADALADGDDIRAVIRGSSVNQDGRTNGLTAPNVASQAEVIRLALADAGVSPDQIGYVEAHGTGTPLGDPIEVEALERALGGRGGEPRCAIGAVKTNLGHLEAAAGMAGLIKAALALGHGELPPNLHLRQVNPRIALDGTRFFFPTEVCPWPRADGPRIAGVSSFGVGGTNAYVILEQPPPAAPPERTPAAAPGDDVELLLISAPTERALASLAEAHLRLAFEADAEDAPFAALCAAAAVRRTHYEQRLAVAARSRGELAERLGAYLRGDPHPGMRAGRVAPSAASGLALVFSGQGGQWVGMGRELIAREPAFRAAIEACDAILRAEEGWSLLAELMAPEPSSRLDRIEILQPALFALQVGLCGLLRALGVEPDAVIGHSMGEVAAACVAGALSLEDAARVIARRSRLLSSLRGRGAMMSVELSPEGAAAWLERLGGRAAVAACNGPASVVLSGDAEALRSLSAGFEAAQIHHRWIQVDVASHSPAVDALLPDLHSALRGISPRRAAIPFYSTVTGAPIGDELLDAAYWVKNVREPVRFWPAAAKLLEDDHRVFVEVGPHPVLLPALEQGLHDLGREAALLPTLRRREGEREALLITVGALWTMGNPVRPAALYPAGARPVRLPPTPWQRERFPPCRHRRAPRAPSSPARRAHPLLGPVRSLAHPPGSHLWEGSIDLEAAPFFRDHRVEETTVAPGTASLDLVLAAAREALGAGASALEAVTFESPILLPDQGVYHLQLLITPEGAGRHSFLLHGRASEGTPWALCARGMILAGAGPEGAPRRVDVASIRARCPGALSGRDFYDRLARSGNEWGPAFRGIERIARGAGEALLDVSAPEIIRHDLGRHAVHPALLDACGQALSAALPDGDPRARCPFVLAGMERVVIHGPLGARAQSHIVLRERQQPGSLEADIQIMDDASRLALELSGVRIRFIDDGGELARGAGRRLDAWLHEVRWVPAEVRAPGSPPAPCGGWLLLADRGGVGERLFAIATRLGMPCLLASPEGETLRASAAMAPAGPADGGGVESLLARLPADGPPWLAVDLSILDVPSGEDRPARALAASIVDGAAAVLRLLRGLSAGRARHRIGLVTRGAQPVGAGAVALSHAPLWGLGRVIAAEQPERFGGMVDLPPDADAGEAAALLAQALGAPQGEPEIALRDGRHCVARLVRAAPRGAQRPLSLSPDASYLITGGLGGLGLEVARRLVERGARGLILLTRSGLPPREAWAGLAPESAIAARVRAVRDLEALGATVHTPTIDAGDEEALSAYLAGLERDGSPPIRGIVHAAGIAAARPLDELDRAALEADLRAKVIGGLVLHRAVRGPLDFFVSFSSASALLASPLLGGYAAANAFLDALAHHRRARALPAQSVNWGFWSSVGMAARREHEEERRLMPRGVESFAPEEGLDLLERLIATDPVQVAVMPVDWNAWARAYPEAARSPTLSALVRGDTERSHGPPGDGALRDALAQAAPAQRSLLLEAFITQQVARVLRSPADRVARDLPLLRLGFDSLMAVELKNRIASALGVSIPLVKILGSPGVSHLAAEIEVAGRPDDDDDEWETVAV